MTHSHPLGELVQVTRISRVAYYWSKRLTCSVGQGQIVSLCKSLAEVYREIRYCCRQHPLFLAAHTTKRYNGSVIFQTFSFIAPDLSVVACLVERLRC